MEGYAVCWVFHLPLGRLLLGMGEMCKKIPEVTGVETLLNKAGSVGIFCRY